MTSTPFPRLQASAAGTAGVVVVRRSTLVLYMCVKVVKALGQLRKRRGAFSWAARLELSAQHRGVELVHRCFPTGEKKRPRVCTVDIPPSLSKRAFECEG